LPLPDATATTSSAMKNPRIRPRDGNIMVHGCFDHDIYLHFEGVGILKQFDKERRIVLSWGEHPEDRGEQVLWTENTRQ
jgi:hypothetical protein